MRILIAEDDPISRKMLEGCLIQWGYEVVVTSDGDEAWTALQRRDGPKLAILDWMMPGMDGVQVCREVRKRVREPYVYLLLLTAKSQKKDIIEALDAGADDYLTKPFDADELKVRLRAGKRILDLQEYLLSASQAAESPATLDSLTGVRKQEAIVGVLREELERSGAQPLGILLADIDNVENIYKTYGTLARDTVLREVARRMRSAVQPYGSIGRYGGKRFLIVIPGCSPSQILDYAEKLRACVSEEPIDVLNGVIPVTVSLGVATTDKSKDAGELIRMADAAVSRAIRRWL